MKVTIGISGASGVNLGLKLLKLMPKDINMSVVISTSAKKVMKEELNVPTFKDGDIGAPIASGSYMSDIMLIVPCSMNTLAKISAGIADTLLTRAAAVMIKERKPLLISPREMPLSSIALENMLKLAQVGVIIAPPNIGYYSDCSNLNDMENFIIGRMLDFVGIKNNLYKRWGNEQDCNLSGHI